MWEMHVPAGEMDALDTDDTDDVESEGVSEGQSEEVWWSVGSSVEVIMHTIDRLV